jgi:hypothetical protein
MNIIRRSLKAGLPIDSRAVEAASRQNQCRFIQPKQFWLHPDLRHLLPLVKHVGITAVTNSGIKNVALNAPMVLKYFMIQHFRLTKRALMIKVLSQIG